MAVSRPTPKDIGNYEAKLIGPFTQRQTVCLAIGIVPSVIVAFALKAIGMDPYLIVGFVIAIMAIPCFLAFGQKFTYGMKPEDFVISYYQYNILSSRIRLYKTVTMDDKLEEEKRLAEEKLQKKRGKKKPKKEDKKKNANSKNAMGTRFLSPKYTAYTHKSSKQYKGYK